MFNFHNLKKWVACTNWGIILHRLNFLVTTVFNFHNLKKWVACVNCNACLNDQWAQHWDWRPSVFQAGATILNRSNFMVTTIFNFHNLQKWVACADCGACLKDQWVQQWDHHPLVFQAGAAILNKSNFVVTTIFNFHNLKKWVACADCGACLKG